MKIKQFKFDKGWKYLIYFDFVLPALLFLLAWLSKVPSFSMLFHSYLTFVISPIPKLYAFTGIIGLFLHIGLISTLLIKKRYKDAIICSIIALLVAAFFFFELNYMIIKPLEFANL